MAVLLSQEPYIKELLSRLDLQHIKEETSPAIAGTQHKLTKAMEASSVETKAIMASVPYREAVGALHWLCRATCPGIAHAVSTVAKFMQNPGPKHWKAVKRIYAYLKRTAHIPLTIKANGGLEIEAYTDADWAGDPDTARSTTGFLVFVGNTLVSWRSKMQLPWAQSATEAEYGAALLTSNEVIWWRNIIQQDNFAKPPLKPTTIWTDNEGARQSDHACAFDATKHWRIAFYTLRSRSQDNIVILKRVASAHNLADYLTKPVQPRVFVDLVGRALRADLKRSTSPAA